MKKFAAIATLFMLFPVAGAGFVSTSIDIEANSPPPIGLDESETIVANVTLNWGFGSFLPLPVEVYIELENVPDWLSVYVSPSKFTVTPDKIMGGSKGENVKITFKANKEVTAFIEYPVKIHAYTNGSFILRGSEATKEIYVMEDFVDNGLTIEKPSAVQLYRGELKTVYFNVTNNCNAPIYIEIEEENTSGFLLSYDEKIPVEAKGKAAIPIKIEAEESKEADIRLRFNYYPQFSPSQETVKNYEEIQLTLMSRTKPQGGALAVGIVIVIIVLILFAIWKKRR